MRRQRVSNATAIAIEGGKDKSEAWTSPSSALDDLRAAKAALIHNCGLRDDAKFVVHVGAGVSDGDLKEQFGLHPDDFIRVATSPRYLRAVPVVVSPLVKFGEEEMRRAFGTGPFSPEGSL